jgi:hypothetical protein
MNGRSDRGMTARTVVAPMLLVLLVCGAVRAQTSYTIQPIARPGDSVDDVVIRGPFAIGALNDDGQLIFKTPVPTGGRLEGEGLFQFAGDKLTPIALAGRDGPVGKWPGDLYIYQPVSMNRQGNVVFAGGVTIGNKLNEGTFLWDFSKQRLAPVALPGPAANNLVFEWGGGHTPVINNHNEIALVAWVKNAARQEREGLFLGRDGTLAPVALPDQDLPDGYKLDAAFHPSLNDGGVVAFIARRRGEGQNATSAYVWENGAITPVAVIRADAPDGRKIASVRGVRVNNADRSVLVIARTTSVGDTFARPEALYRFADGRFVPVAVKGQEMPGGGVLNDIQQVFHNPGGVSFANDRGQYAFLARLQGGATAAYLAEADGKLSLILKSGTTTERGTVTSVGQEAGGSTGVGLNNKGQVALTVTIDGGVPTVVLLTPAAP